MIIGLYCQCPVSNITSITVFLCLKKIEAKREREGDNFGRAFFNTAEGKIQPRKQWNQLYISVWIGRLDREGGGQSGLCRPPMRAVQQGLLAGASPPGELSLPFSPSLSLSLSSSLYLPLSVFGPMGLSESLGSKTVEAESLQGPYRHQASSTLRGAVR